MNYLSPGYSIEVCLWLGCFSFAFVLFYARVFTFTFSFSFLLFLFSFLFLFVLGWTSTWNLCLCLPGLHHMPLQSNGLLIRCRWAFICWYNGLLSAQLLVLLSMSVSLPPWQACSVPVLFIFYCFSFRCIRQWLVDVVMLSPLLPCVVLNFTPMCVWFDYVLLSAHPRPSQPLRRSIIGVVKHQAANTTSTGTRRPKLLCSVVLPLLCVLLVAVSLCVMILMMLLILVAMFILCLLFPIFVLTIGSFVVVLGLVLLVVVDPCSI